jgi:hypothetical protein
LAPGVHILYVRPQRVLRRQVFATLLADYLILVTPGRDVSRHLFTSGFVRGDACADALVLLCNVVDVVVSGFNFDLKSTFQNFLFFSSDKQDCSSLATK